MNYNTNYTPGKYTNLCFCEQQNCVDNFDHLMPRHTHPCTDHHNKQCKSRCNVIEVDMSDVAFFMLGYLIARNCK